MEFPAGLLDVPGEAKLDCAKRELAEEANLAAGIWEELISFHATPGGNSESITIFVAKDLSNANSDYVTSGEEKDMPQTWVSIQDALARVLSSDIKSPTAVVGIMAYALKTGILAK
jgi:ADP-ribose pyrophosphatase